MLTHHINRFLSIRSPKTLQSLIEYHAYIITTGHHSTNVFISSKLISLYAYLHKPASSKQVFDSFNGYRDVFLWNSIIKAYFSNGMYPQCLDSYASMRVLTTLMPNQFTVPMVVSACAEVGDLVHGMIVHGLVFKVGMFEGSSAIGSSFVYMYSKCGHVDSARQVFDEMYLRDVVAWTSLVIGYVQNGESAKGLRCVCKMYRICGEDARPNFRTLEGAFQACGNLEAVYAGRCLHGVVAKSGLGCYTVVQSSILSMYSKCGTLEEAYMSFCEVPVKDIKSWTSIIGVYGKWGCITRSLGGFMEMLVAGIDPDPMVVSCLIYGLSNSICISAGKTFHGFMIRRHYQMVHNALVSMYCKFGLISYAENVFNGVCILEEEVWNAMVCGYGKVKCGVKCIDLFTEMLHLGINPDPYSLVSVISSCSQMGEMHLGRSLHTYAVKSLVKEHTSVLNSLIDMYSNLGEVAIARKLFCRTNKDIITWNTMISAYTHCGNYAEAFSLFNKMVLEGTKPTTTTIISMLSACAHMASFEKGEQIHKYIDQEMLSSNLTLATALVDMYAKCGQLEKSKNIFNKMTKRDIISWNVMISGYGMHGDAQSAIDTFQQMEQSNAKPNELTFLAVLSACSHAGLVDEGKSLFGRMGDYSLKPTLKHYACMVNLLGRSGYLLEAENLVLSMPIVPDGGLWGALLSACKTHNNPEMGIRIAKRAIECDPENDGYYVIVSNLYDSIGMWEEAEWMRNLMKERGVEKAVGWSAV
ncbi:Pentatricopeptide repeat-containing protein [Cynara cardunculus var. scolymus]|uniref:Pentatricopeptide repeat-containing protein n=2 Tax=Cynara cardunculus var. scolymus TaxID=59895 RepID=A0A103Y632_CYNCS|nr:Pentatricopeptide repeat-containing protein [Cynara cardunculus var. scolymus]